MALYAVAAATEHLCVSDALCLPTTAVSVHPCRIGPPKTVLAEYAALAKLIRAYTPLSRT